MSEFDTVLIVDWSGGRDRGPRPVKDAIWVGGARGTQSLTPLYCRNRGLAERCLTDLLRAELTAGRRVLVGFDFGFAYPAGFARALTGHDDPLGVWEWLESRIGQRPADGTEVHLAAEINRSLGEEGPFWGNPYPKREISGLPRKKPVVAGRFADRRRVEERARGTQSLWKLAGAGSVGRQTLTGLPVLARLRRVFAGAVTVWPFERPEGKIVFAEVWPSLINRRIEADAEPGEIRDRAQVRLLSRALACLSAERLADMLAQGDAEEGWILGLGYEDQLNETARIEVPPLRNDCFALPPGVDWIPVETALTRLRAGLRPVTATEPHALGTALNRVLAAPAVACRAHPPSANAAVDGYGFACDTLPQDMALPLVTGRAAAGHPYEGVVPAGQAVRVLTGATLPEGVDTVVLQEDVTVIDGILRFGPGVRRGANTRMAGEDVALGQTVLEAGRRLGPAELALLSAVGIAEVRVRRALRVALLSTGDELCEAGDAAGPAQIYDANRPMLSALVTRLGHEVVDLGLQPDERQTLRAALDQAAQEADVILTSGGASAGDEDHVSALLREAGALQQWRIAIKPGRPLAMGVWSGKPVFGLPGNPVAAFTCALIFARPAMAVLAGEAWPDAHGFEVPAAFEKRKKPGRHEYLRARIREGRAEVFPSEGSGRISSLSWADGFVALGADAAHIRPGDPVHYIPFSSFGI